MRLIQLSDCHLPRRPGTPYRGVDAHANLDLVLESVRAWSPELILATGDLSEDASDEAYAWLARKLDELEVPVLVLPGNHDAPERLREHFPDTTVDAPLVHDTPHWRLVLLNSVIPGQVPGRLDETALAQLDHVLSERPMHTLVALHQQPMPIGSPWIDRFPLLEPEGFHEVLARHATVRLVTWGHVHQAFDATQSGIRWLSGPSSASNSLPGGTRFTPDPSGPACRWLVLAEDGGVETGILNAVTG